MRSMTTSEIKLGKATTLLDGDDVTIIASGVMVSKSLEAAQKLQKEGESGRRKMNQYTRYLTVIILILQAPTYLEAKQLILLIDERWGDYPAWST